MTAFSILRRIFSFGVMAIATQWAFGGMPEVRAALPATGVAVSSSSNASRTAVPTPAAAPAATVSGAQEQRLTPMDVIDVRVFAETELSGRRPIDSDGTISLSVVGAVPVAGLTPSQAAEKIRILLKDGWMVNPKVEVVVAAYAKRSVSVMGEVAKPGSVDIRPGQPLDLVQALAGAGGITARGNARAVIVKRGNKVYEFDAYKMATTSKSASFMLQADDIVTVKTRLF